MSAYSWRLRRSRQQRLSSTGGPPGARPSRRLRWRPLLDALEQRTLPSTILWTNRGSSSNDSDGFNAVFGSSADIARSDVDAAIADWQNTIASFNYSDPS